MLTIGIVGLGLIGGSLAMALRGFEDCRILGADCDAQTLAFARWQGICDEVFSESKPVLAQADLVILALHPRGIERFLQEETFRSGSIVTDVCGVKTAILAAAQHLPQDVTFIGGHPMAGRECGGIAHASEGLFRGAHYILTPCEGANEAHVNLLRRMAQHIGCRDVTITTAQEHDRLIAYTSQVMHIMALAVCDDPNLFDCRGFEGGSFRDCTRVAALDVPLWSQLFSMNAPALTGIIRNLEEHLRDYRAVLEDGDLTRLEEKLQFSSDRKRKMNLE